MSSFKIENRGLLIAISFLAVFLLLFAISGVNAGNYHVNGTDEGSDSSTTGDSVDPFASIGRAVNETNNQGGSDNKIIIKNGTYSGGKNTRIVINKSVDIYGARYFYGDPRYGDTIIDGESINQMFQITNGSNVNFYGIIFANGFSDRDGGAIYSNESTCKFFDVEFTNCYSYRSFNTWGYGGAIYAYHSPSSPGNIDNWSFTNVVFNNCSGNGSGGAIFASNGQNWSFLNVLFNDCNSGIFGGAVFSIFGNDWSFNDVIFTNCNANSYAGAVYGSYGDNWSFRDVTFTNCAVNTGGGGALTGDGSDWHFENVNFTDCASNFHGGAIYSYGNIWSFVNVKFANCTSLGYGGGAVYGEDANDWSFRDVSFTNCTSNIGGGAVLGNSTSGGTLNNWTFVGVNFTDCVSYRDGGAVYAENGTLWSFTDVNLIKCSSYGNGGAVYVENAALWSFTDVNFKNCTSINGGGAVYSANALPNYAGTFLNVLFADCTADGGSGGAIYTYGANWLISNCRFINSTSRGSYGGGAIYLGNLGSLNITDCEFFNNRAIDGVGGAISTNGTLNITGSNFVGNTATWGSGIFADTGANVYMDYCRLANNTASMGYQLVNSGSGTVIADHNWWGINEAQSQVYGATLNNWFVMILNSTSTNLKVGDTIIYNYYFMLNNTFGDLSFDADLMSKMPMFNATLRYNGGIVYINDARRSYEDLSVIVNDTYNNISAYDIDFVTDLVFGSDRGISNIVVSNVTGDYGSEITLEATLKNKNGESIVGKIVSFYDGLGNWIANAITDNNGIARYTFIPGLNAGNYMYSASFEGDDYYLGSNGTGTILINKLQTVITPEYTNFTGTIGKYVYLRATLRDINGNLLLGKNVDIYINGIKVATVQTDNRGLVSYYHYMDKTGIQSVEFIFSGDINYLNSSANSELVVEMVQPPASNGSGNGNKTPHGPNGRSGTEKQYGYANASANMKSTGVPIVLAILALIFTVGVVFRRD